MFGNALDTIICNMVTKFLPAMFSRALMNTDALSSLWQVSNYTHYKVWDEIIYPFDFTVDVWEWIYHFNPHLIRYVFMNLYCELNYSVIVREDPGDWCIINISYQQRKSYMWRSYDRVISTMGFLMPVRRHLHTESGSMWTALEWNPSRSVLFYRGYLAKRALSAMRKHGGRPLLAGYHRYRGNKDI